MEKAKTPALGLLEYVSFKAGLVYLSDLHNPLYWPKIQRILCEIDCHAYDLHEWKDAVAYLTGESVPFTDEEQAAFFLQNYPSPREERP